MIDNNFQINDLVRGTVQNYNTKKRCCYGPVCKVTNVRKNMVLVAFGQYCQWLPKTAIRKLSDEEAFRYILER